MFAKMSLQICRIYVGGICDLKNLKYVSLLNKEDNLCFIKHKSCNMCSHRYTICCMNYAHCFVLGIFYWIIAICIPKSSLLCQVWVTLTNTKPQQDPTEVSIKMRILCMRKMHFKYPLRNGVHFIQALLHQWARHGSPILWGVPLNYGSSCTIGGLRYFSQHSTQ